MAKVSKEMQWRMEGMVAAYKIVKENGLEELKKEMQMRNFLKVDIWARRGEVAELHKMVSENVYMSMLSTVMFVLHDTFGFGKKRLDLMKSDFDKKIENISDLDWLGNNYVRFEDYGVYLNEKFGYEFDVDRIAVLHDRQDEQNKLKGKCDVQILIRRLKDAGFNDAAEWLEGRVN